MVHYKLYYFNARGRAELARLVFAAAGVEYEDVRIQGDDWAKLKPTMPFGQMPVLEIDGKKYAQSKAIARYIATKHGLAGCNAEEHLQADVIVDAVGDVVDQMMKFSFEKDEAKKAELKDAFIKEGLPKALKNLEACVSSSGFFVGKGLTWADIAFFKTSTWILEINPGVLDGYPKLKALAGKVEKNDKVAAWLKKRPVTNM